MTRPDRRQPVASLPLLLLPGTLCDAELWDKVQWNSPVHGPSVLRGATLEEAADRALRDAPGQLHVVGFSLGAIVACEVLRQAPARVARLTLLAVNPQAPTPTQLQTWAHTEACVHAGEFDRLVSALPSPQRAMAGRVGPAAYLEQLALMRSRPDSRSTLAAYAGPLTLLVGQDDSVTPPRLSHDLQALRHQTGCGPTRLQIVVGAGHFLPLDAPQVVGAATGNAQEPAYG